MHINCLIYKEISGTGPDFWFFLRSWKLWLSWAAFPWGSLLLQCDRGSPPCGWDVGSPCHVPPPPALFTLLHNQSGPYLGVCSPPTFDLK